MNRLVYTSAPAPAVPRRPGFCAKSEQKAPFPVEIPARHNTKVSLSSRVRIGHHFSSYFALSVFPGAVYMPITPRGDRIDLRPLWEPMRKNHPADLSPSNEYIESPFPRNWFPKQEPCKALGSNRNFAWQLPPWEGLRRFQPAERHHQGGIGLAPISHCPRLWQFMIMIVRSSLPCPEANQPAHREPPAIARKFGRQ